MILAELNPDIICLQEIHENETYNQLSEIAERLGFEHRLTHRISDKSFMDSSFSFSQGIISKEPRLDSQKIILDYKKWTH